MHNYALLPFYLFPPPPIWEQILGFKFVWQVNASPASANLVGCHRLLAQCNHQGRPKPVEAEMVSLSKTRTPLKQAHCWVWSRGGGFKKAIPYTSCIIFGIPVLCILSLLEFYEDDMLGWDWVSPLTWNWELEVSSCNLEVLAGKVLEQAPIRVVGRCSSWGYGG